ncbi:MAG: UDP-N-acetylmuramate--L-alanine ligase [Selenomonadaceae bacterium]|nr:UDP-N-acetylmuramate--L-alanine ligase [Selenomonadaceae bacterium]
MKELQALKGLKKIHFVGIGGAGMSPLAKILTELGYEVSGSDTAKSDIIDNLKALGAVVYDKQDGENVRGKDAIVVSSAIPFDNPEVLAAGSLKIPKLHRSDINAALVNEYKGIAVAGAHGKTTTTSMIGVALDAIGKEPTVIVGGVAPDLGTNAKLGKSEYLVSEADESDGSFLKLRPYIAVVTNVENDHMDHYGTMDNIRAAFKEFIEYTDKNTGYAVLCYDSPELKAIAENIDRNIISYGISSQADYMAKNIAMENAGEAFDLFVKGEFKTRVKLNLPGKHNVLNALATIAVGNIIGVSPEEMAKGLTTFHGAKRRFETKGRKDGVWVLDDYAHHPTEIAMTLKAAKETKPKKLVAVFQPHRYSRTKLLKEEFGEAFISADELILTDIYSAGEEPIEGISGETVLEEVVKQTNQEVVYIKDKNHIAKYVKEKLKEETNKDDANPIMIMTMGAGDIYKIGEEIAKNI